MDYRRALRYQFDSPDWGMNLLFVTLAMLVPLVGPVIAFGYQATVVEALARGGAAAPAPRFDFERLADYLTRGLRVFVVTVLLTLLITPVAFVIVLVGNLSAVFLFAQEDAAASMLGCAVVGLIIVLFIAAMVLAVSLATPLLVRAALDPDLGGVFDVGFARDFLARTWRETVQAHLVHVAINLGLFVLGLLACFIGIFPALTLGTLVQAHLLGQLYLLYLERGGRRIEPA
jgi:hypothetical protein